MKHEAIYNLYPNVKCIDESSSNITAMDGNGNEISIDMDAVNTKATELQTAYDNEQDTLKTNKVSGFRKMGLTDDEILAQDNSLGDYL